jgi:Fe-S cluster biosynthesis and repair protein YggX
MKVYIVGEVGAEHNIIKSVHKTREGALKAWNKHRLYLLNDAKRSLKASKNDKDMYKKMVRNLSCKDPEKIDNGPWETPYIRIHEVKQ